MKELSPTAVPISREIVQAAYKESGSEFLQKMLVHQMWVFSADIILDCNVCKIAVGGRYPRSVKYDLYYEFSPEMVPSLVKHLEKQGHSADALNIFRERLDVHYYSSRERLLVS